jgi:hypothetical protein
VRRPDLDTGREKPWKGVSPKVATALLLLTEGLAGQSSVEVTFKGVTYTASTGKPRVQVFCRHCTRLINPAVKAVNYRPTLRLQVKGIMWPIDIFIHRECLGATPMSKAHITPKGGHFTSAGLEVVAESLQKALGDYWRVRVVPKKDPENTFDPAVVYAEATLWGFSVRVCADGEVYLDGAMSEVFSLSMPEAPQHVGQIVTRRLRELNAEPEPA